jgi:hypothetical protein
MMLFELVAHTKVAGLRQVSQRGRWQLHGLDAGNALSSTTTESSRQCGKVPDGPEQGSLFAPLHGDIGGIDRYHRLQHIELRADTRWHTSKQVKIHDSCPSRKWWSRWTGRRSGHVLCTLPRNQ